VDEAERVLVETIDDLPASATRLGGLAQIYDRLDRAWMRSYARRRDPLEP
jgi:hypothetical protein